MQDKMNKKKSAVMLADTRSSLVGVVLLQLQETNKGLFDEAIIYYIDEIPESDRNLMSSIMPCRFIKYSPPLSDRLFDLPRFKQLSKLMFVRYDIFSLLDEYETIAWMDTDILIQSDIAGILDLARITGYSMVREDSKNKTEKNPDHMKTCFLELPEGKEYNLQSYLFHSGLIAVSDKLGKREELTKYCYDKTTEWAEILILPDQGVLNAMIQDFDILVSPIRGSDYCCYPYYGRDCSNAAIIHAWGNNKFWNDWYLHELYPAWQEYHDKWVALGGQSLKKDFHPAISILIPVFKPNIGWFRECLDSIIGQTQNGYERYSDFEIIVISELKNGKDVRMFLDSYTDPRIILLVNDKRLGIAGSLNRGMQIARGDYIARIDGDDLMVQERMFKQKKYLDNNLDITLCSSDFEYFGDIHEYRRTFSCEMSKAWSVITCPFDHSTIMFRREFFLKNDLFYNEERSHVEDWELWLRALERGMVVYSIPEILTRHRWHANGGGGTKETTAAMCELVKKNMECLGVDVSTDVLPYIGPWSGRVEEYIYRKLDALFVKALANNYEVLLYDPDGLKTIFEYRLHEAKTGQLSAEIAGDISSYISSERTQQAVSFQPLKRKRLKYKILDSLFKPIYKQFKCEVSDIKKEVLDVKKEVVSEIKNLEYENQFLKKVFYSNLGTSKKIFLLGTSEHDNIGDVAITIGVYEFIRKYFSEYKLVDVSCYHMQADFKYISGLIRDDDVIFLQGGGNLGNMYMIEENIRRRTIESFPANKIFILPQTIWFSDDERGKAELDKSTEIYGRHNGLVLFTRGKESLSLAKAYFPSMRCMNMIDMALMLSRDYAFDRKGILVCIRDLGDESGLDEKIHNEIFDIIRKTELNYQQTKNRYGKDILPLMAGEVVNNELMKYARSKIVVTDRLHGMLFSVITKTPCVVMDSYTHKIDEFSEFFAGSNAVFFIGKDISKLQDTMAKAFLTTEPKYPILEKGLFDKMADYIRTTMSKATK